MKPLLAALLLAASAAGAEPAKPADKKAAPAPHPVTVTFYVSGVESDKDVEAIVAGLKKVTSFTKAEGLAPKSGFVNVSFDSHVSSFQQVAQAVADAAGSSGRKYEVSLKIKVPEYAQGDNAA